MVDEKTPLFDEPVDPSIPLDSEFEDEVAHMTYARRIARRLSKYKWYYPHVASDDPNKPSLDAAWAYFEHITLGRHFLPKEGSKDLFQKAESGENEEPTRLYSVMGTMETDLADFGDAVGVYFFTLRALAFMMFVAALISLPTMIYYHSEEYSFKSVHFKSIFLESSAICHDQTWEACPTCKLSDWSRFPVTYSRYANTTLPTGETLSFIRVNNCDVNSTVAFWGYASLLFVVFCVYLLDGITKEKELDFDAAQQTATDYALEVENPPEDARDPKEWLDFFEQFGRVTVLTIALDNEELTDPLLMRRKLLVKLKNLIPVGEEFDPERLDDMVAMTNVPKFPMSLLLGTPEKIKEKILELEDDIRACMGKIFPVSEVFVIFETEHAQRAAYKKLVVSGADVEDNNTHALPKNYVFRGDCVLNLIEPPEPSSVRWMDLDESAGFKLRRRILTTIITIVVTIFLAGIILLVRALFGPVYAAFAITGVNSGAPMICRVINMLEAHEREGQWESSLYGKITAITWMSSTLLTAFVSPFVNTLDNQKRSFIPSMYAIFLADLYISPAIQLFDIPGFLKRHILGPRAPDQRRMNAMFQGTEYQLSARYTDMTKVLFMTFYTAFIFPAGWLIAGLTLTVHYWVDKFCLLRIWAPSALIDNSIARMSRRYFFSSALAVFAVMMTFNFASFPFDNSCVVNTTMPSAYVGHFNATVTSASLKGTVDTTISVEIDASDTVYKFCDQDMLRYQPFAVFPVPSNQPEGAEWMNSAQNSTPIYAWTALGVLFYVVMLFMRDFWDKIRNHYFAPPQPPDKPHPEEFFSDVKEVFGYVPQTMLPGTLFPTLLCDISEIDQELVGWDDPTDPEKKSHNAVHDLDGLATGDDATSLFSIVKHYPHGNDEDEFDDD